MGAIINTGNQQNLTGMLQPVYMPRVQPRTARVLPESLKNVNGISPECYRILALGRPSGLRRERVPGQWEGGGYPGRRRREYPVPPAHIPFGSTMGSI